MRMLLVSDVDTTPRIGIFGASRCGTIRINDSGTLGVREVLEIDSEKVDKD
jgi:hypothetical protein